jgi:protein TonB
MLEDTMVESAALNSLFADSLLQASWAQRTRRSWTTLTSFGLQVLALGLLLLLPVLKTVGLPAARTVSTPITLGRRSAMPLAESPRSAAPTVARNTVVPLLVAPGRVPRHIPIADDASVAPPDGPGGGTVGSGFSLGAADGPPMPLISGTNVVPVFRPTIAHAIRTSTMLEGNLIRRVEPVYPPLARTARIQGSVVLSALISKDGVMENLHALSGPPMLVPAAISAVSQWRYRPYILNGEPIEVETQITVNFVLAGN